MKFGSKRAIFGVIFFFLGGWTLFGNQPPHPPTFEKAFPNKTVYFFDGSPKEYDGIETFVFRNDYMTIYRNANVESTL